MQSHDPEKDHGTIHCWKLARHRKEGRHKTFSEVSDILFLFLFFLGSVWKRSVKSYYSSLNTLLVYPFLCVSNALCKNGGGGTRTQPLSIVNAIVTCTVAFQPEIESLQKIWKPQFFWGDIQDWIFVKAPVVPFTRQIKQRLKAVKFVPQKILS